jgi:archaellum component FlaC
MAVLAEAQARTEQALQILIRRVDEIGTRLDRMDQRFDGVDQRLDRMDQRFDGVDQRLDRMDQRFDGVDQRFGEVDRRFERVEARLGRMQGRLLEISYRDHAGAYFADVLRRVRVVSTVELDDLLTAGEASGVIDRAAAREVRRADLILHGRRLDDGQETYVLVEVSAGIGPDDVQRAVRRAEVLGKLYPTMAAVAGERLIPEAEALARSSRVWQVVDGHAEDPAPAGGT